MGSRYKQKTKKEELSMLKKFKIITKLKAMFKKENGHKNFVATSSQNEIAFEAFIEKPRTMLMVSEETGISRANLCRYVSLWLKSNSIHTVGLGLCDISNCPATILTMNPNLISKLNLINHESTKS